MEVAKVYKKQKIADEKQSDVERMSILTRNEEDLENKERMLHDQVKKEIIDHYEELNKAADAKVKRAKWKKDRRQLDLIRLQFIVQEKVTLDL